MGVRAGGAVRRIALASAAGLTATVLAACSGGSGADDAADALAEALSAGNVSDVRATTDGTANQADLVQTLEGLGGSAQKVSVSEVAADGDAATVTLETRRTVRGAAWTYETTASLVKDDGDWTVEWDRSIVADVTAEERLVGRTVEATRGEILGAGGEALVTARPVVRIGIDKTRVPAPESGASAEALAALVGIDPAAYRGRVEGAGPQAFVEGLVLRAGPEVPSADALAAIPGAVGLPDEIPLGPSRTFAQPLLGVVGEATAEIVEESEGEIGAGDRVGLSGLQRRYDDALRGTPGVTVDAVDDDPATESRTLFTSDPVAGESLATTIDPLLQTAAETALAGVGPASAIVAVRPSTGEVVALANGPGTEGTDIAATGRYAPGSTFKVVSALGLLRSGLRPAATLECPATVTVDGRVFENYSDYPASVLGGITLRSAIANSCNTAVIGARDQVPQQALTAAAAALGLGRDVDLGVPAFFGSVPAEAGETEHAASMIGQGRIEASPLAMAVVAASVQQRGLVTPVLLPEHRPDEEPDEPATPLTDAEAVDLADLMRAVVIDGSGRLLADLPGDPVGAKTGTAEYGDAVPPATHAWMIATQGDLAVAVFVADGASGSGTAGPLLEAFLRAVA